MSLKDRYLSIKDLEEALDALTRLPPNEPIYLTHPKHKAHMQEHPAPVLDCRDCLIAWGSIQRV